MTVGADSESEFGVSKSSVDNDPFGFAADPNAARNGSDVGIHGIGT